MKVLIIGSKGFIGSYVYEHFSKMCDCFCADIHVDYADKKYFQVSDDEIDFFYIFDQVKFDICINCSGAASVQNSILHPLYDFSLNTLNIVKILDAIRVHSPKCFFINLSSAAVYGNPTKLPVHEHDETAPISPYGIHKSMAERVCQMYKDFYGIKTCNLRIFSAYGIGLKKQLLWEVSKKLLETDNLELFGTGEETRDFIHISDIVQAIDKIAFSKNKIYTIINIANGKEVTVKRIATLLRDALELDIEIKFNNETRQGDPIAWAADIARLSSVGYKQTMSINDGVKEYASWSKNEILE